jgi:hypothetical protein
MRLVLRALSWQKTRVKSRNAETEQLMFGLPWVLQDVVDESRPGRIPSQVVQMFFHQLAAADCRMRVRSFGWLARKQ